MLATTAVLLSIGAINALVPILIILILIAASAGLTRGWDAFSMFGISALAGIGSPSRGMLARRSAFTGSAGYSSAGSMRTLVGYAHGKAQAGIRNLYVRAQTRQQASAIVAKAMGMAKPAPAPKATAPAMVGKGANVRKGFVKLAKTAGASAVWMSTGLGSGGVFKPLIEKEKKSQENPGKLRRAMNMIGIKSPTASLFTAISPYGMAARSSLGKAIGKHIPVEKGGMKKGEGKIAHTPLEIELSRLEEEEEKRKAEIVILTKKLNDWKALRKGEQETLLEKTKALDKEAKALEKEQSKLGEGQDVRKKEIEEGLKGIEEERSKIFTKEDRMALFGYRLQQARFEHISRINERIQTVVKEDNMKDIEQKTKRVTELLDEAYGRSSHTEMFKAVVSRDRARFKEEWSNSPRALNLILAQNGGNDEYMRELAKKPLAKIYTGGDKGAIKTLDNAVKAQMAKRSFIRRRIRDPIAEKQSAILKAGMEALGIGGEEEEG